MEMSVCLFWEKRHRRPLFARERRTRHLVEPYWLCRMSADAVSCRLEMMYLGYAGCAKVDVSRGRKVQQKALEIDPFPFLCPCPDLCLCSSMPRQQFPCPNLGPETQLVRTANKVDRGCSSPNPSPQTHPRRRPASSSFSLIACPLH